MYNLNLLYYDVGRLTQLSMSCNNNLNMMMMMMMRRTGNALMMSL